MATMKKIKSYDEYMKEYYAQQKALQQYQKQSNPGAYNSAYAAQLKNALSNIENRKPFSYDPNSDALYQQYKNQYAALGKLAMQNTMGQAAALTGGYGNSYAASAGQQAYNNYMQQAANMIPELYQLAASRYDADTNNLYKLYDLYQNADTTDYGRYRDRVGDYQTELARLTSLAQNERSYATDRYNTDYSNAYNMWRAQTSDEQAAAERAEAVRQYNEQMAFNREKFEYEKQQDALAAAARAYSGSGGGGGKLTATEAKQAASSIAGAATNVTNSIASGLGASSGKQLSKQDKAQLAPQVKKILTGYNSGKYDTDKKDAKISAVVKSYVKAGYPEDVVYEYIHELEKDYIR